MLKITHIEKCYIFQLPHSTLNPQDENAPQKDTKNKIRKQRKEEQRAGKNTREKVGKRQSTQKTPREQR